MKSIGSIISASFLKAPERIRLVLLAALSIAGLQVSQIAAQTTPHGVLANISTRGYAGDGINALIGGFILAGNQSKKLMIRGIGPSLPLPGTLADPDLAIYENPGGLDGDNDDWITAPNKQEIIDSTLAPRSNLESAVLASFAPNFYTAVVYGGRFKPGIALVEIYDLDLNSDSTLANISTRGLVQTGDNALIGGFVVLGQAPLKVIVRAIGPTLIIPGPLADPTLELRDRNGVLLASNDNWRTDQQAEIIGTTIPPKDERESAIVRTLEPGAYTAIVRGVNNTTGLALVEVYALN